MSRLECGSQRAFSSPKLPVHLPNVGDPIGVKYKYPPSRGYDPDPPKTGPGEMIVWMMLSVPPEPSLNPPRLSALQIYAFQLLGRKFLSDLGSNTFPFLPIVMARRATPFLPLNTVGSSRATPPEPRSRSPASIPIYSYGSK